MLEEQHARSEDDPYAAGPCDSCLTGDGRDCTCSPLDCDELFESLREHYGLPGLRPPEHWMPVIEWAQAVQFDRAERGWPVPRDLPADVQLAFDILVDEQRRLERALLKHSQRKSEQALKSKRHG